MIELSVLLEQQRSGVGLQLPPQGKRILREFGVARIAVREAEDARLAVRGTPPVQVLELLNHHNGAAALRELPCCGGAHASGTDHHHVHPLGHGTSVGAR